MTAIVHGASEELQYYQVVVRLVLSVLFGAAIGLQRELDHKTAGLTTHSLVTLGATLFVIVSAYGYSDFTTPSGGVDPSRISAQIVSGIGFLGAGAIIKEGWNIIGLTTAACLWVCAAIGMCMGVFLWFPALVATILTLLVLVVFKRLTRLTSIPKIDVTIEDISTSEVAALAKEILNAGMELQHVETSDIYSTQVSHLEGSDEEEEVQIPTGRCNISFVVSRLGKATPNMVASLIIKVVGPAKDFTMQAHSRGFATLFKKKNFKKEKNEASRRYQEHPDLVMERVEDTL